MAKFQNGDLVIKRKGDYQFTGPAYALNRCDGPSQGTPQMADEFRDQARRYCASEDETRL